MAVVDAEVKRHQDTWVAFTRFLTWGSVFVALLLIFLAVVTL
jgi:hypothetical protein